jgi:hypothetical protein
MPLKSRLQEIDANIIIIHKPAPHYRRNYNSILPDDKDETFMRFLCHSGAAFKQHSFPRWQNQLCRCHNKKVCTHHLLRNYQLQFTRFNFTKPSTHYTITNILTYMSTLWNTTTVLHKFGNMCIILFKLLASNAIIRTFN